MPHVIAKLWPGQSEEQKAQITERIVNGITSSTTHSADVVSIAFEEVDPADWAEKVYRPDILGNWESLYKKPGYTI